MDGGQRERNSNLGTGTMSGGRSDRFPEPLAMLDHTSLGAVTTNETEVFYYLADALGSTIGLADARQQGESRCASQTPHRLIDGSFEA